MQKAAVRGARKPGRPRKYGEGRIHATVRFTPEQYAALRAEADGHGRSVSEEVETRIAESFNSGTLQDALATLDSVLDQMRELQHRLAATKRDAKRDEEKLAQIVEDAVARVLKGGNR
jgi:hypothetical protein